MACVNLSRTLGDFKRAIKTYKVAYNESLGIEAQDTMDRGNLRAAFKTFRQMMPWEKAQVAAVRDVDGNIAATPLKIRAAWQRFFIAKFGGFTSSMQDLTHACHARQRDCFPEYTASDVPVELAPTDSDVAKLL